MKAGHQVAVRVDRMKKLIVEDLVTIPAREDVNRIMVTTANRIVAAHGLQEDLRVPIMKMTAEEVSAEEAMIRACLTTEMTETAHVIGINMMMNGQPPETRADQAIIRVEANTEPLRGMIVTATVMTAGIPAVNVVLSIRKAAGNMTMIVDTEIREENGATIVGIRAIEDLSTVPAGVRTPEWKMKRILEVARTEVHEIVAAHGTMTMTVVAEETAIKRLIV